MYYNYFGLNQPPYRITPDTRLFYSGADRGAILHALEYAIKTGEGITKVVGEVGSGKTMLCRMLEDKLPASIEVVYLANPNIAASDVLQAIAMELNLPVAKEKSADRLQIIKALESYLLKKHASNGQVIIFVEEAQGMPLTTLEEIRLLSNLETQEYKLLQIVLFGQPELDDNLSAVHVRQIKDRITNSFYLPPMGVLDIREYLMFRLRSVGYHGPNIFSKTASILIANLSRGLVRRINMLADKAMLAAYANSSSTIRFRHVMAAARDLGFGFAAYLRSGRRVIVTISIVAAIALSTLWLQNENTIALTDNVVAEQSTPDLSQLKRHPGDLQIKTGLPVQRNAKIPDNQTSVLAQRIMASNVWLQQTKPAGYSIQLLYSEADRSLTVERFLSSSDLSGLLDEIYIVQSNADGTPMFNVIYGEFDSYRKAKMSLNSLPAELKRFHPYLRNLHDILKVEVEEGFSS